jgi:hypothetical protein
MAHLPALIALSMLPACAPVVQRTLDSPAASARESLAGCTVREGSRQRLTVEGGRPLYVEADAFVGNGKGDVLLAGTPAYLWQTRPDGEIDGLTYDSIFGAVIARDGSARIVPAPLDPRQIHGIRAAARGDGGWDVVFAEVPPYAGDERPDSVARLWYGRYDGRRWDTLEQIPAPEGVVLDAQSTSSLVRHGDTLAWALRPVFGSVTRQVTVVQRDRGGWSYEHVPTRSGVDLDLIYTDTAGLLLAVVQPDPSLPGDGNSLMLWRQRPEWHLARRLVHGYGEGAVERPSLLHTSHGLLASWETAVGTEFESRRELRARTEEDADERSVVVLDGDVSIWSEAQPLLVLGAPVWVGHHPLPGDRSGDLRILSMSRSAAIELGRVPNPYLLRVATTSTAPAELLTTGMEYVDGRFPFSLLLRFQLACPRRPG